MDKHLLISIAAALLLSTNTSVAQTTIGTLSEAENTPPTSLMLQKVPTQAFSSPVALSDSTISWGEWYEFDSGTMHYGNAESLFGLTPKHVTVMRRDSNDGTDAQLCFKEAFEDTDFMVHLDPATNYMTWDEQVLPLTDDNSVFDGGYVHLNPYTYTGLEWKPKFNIPLSFFYLISPGYGYNGRNAYYQSDNIQASPVVDVKILTQFSLGEYSQCFGRDVKEILLSYANVNHVAVRAEYVWTKDGIYNDNGKEISCSEMFSKGLAKELKEGEFTLSFNDGPGTYQLLIRFYDADGDYVTGVSAGYISNIDDNYEWETRGEGLFDPTRLARFYTEYLSRYTNNKLTPEIRQIKDPYKVTVQERKDAPGVYRIVNPYGPGTPFADIDSVRYSFTDENYADTTYYFDNPDWIVFDHSEPYYIVIDTRDPAKPFVESRNCGMRISNGLGAWTINGCRNESLLYSSTNNMLSIKDGIIAAGFSSDEFTLRLPDAIDVIPNFECTYEENEDNKTVIETMFTMHDATATYVDITYELPIDAYMAKFALIPLEEYDELTVVDKIISGEIESTECRNYGMSETIRLKIPEASASEAAYKQLTISSSEEEEDSKSVYMVVVVTCDAYSRPRQCVSQNIAIKNSSLSLGKKIGEATFRDPLLGIYSFNGIKITDNILYADVYENPEKKGVYTLISPWQFNNFYAPYSNQFVSHCEENHNWVIDARDPERVTITKGYTGFNDVSAAQGHLYCVDEASMNHIYLGHNFDVLDSSCFGKVTTDTDSEKRIDFNRLWIGVQADQDINGFTSYYSDSLPVTVSFTLPTSGIDAVTPDDDNSPVEYYNLQGIKVAEPAPGIYIRKQGEKTSKVLIR